MFRVRITIAIMVSLMAGVQANASVEPIVINAAQDSYTIAPHSKVLIDKENRINIKKVALGELDKFFEPVKDEIPSYGFTTFTYWFKFKVKNDRKEGLHWLLGFEYPMIDRIDVFYKNDGESKWTRRRAGDHFPFAKRDISHRFFYMKMEFDAGKTKEFIVRFRTAGSSEFPMYIKSPYQLQADDHHSQLVQGMFLGFMGILAAYNILLFIGSKKSEYLYYTLFLSAVALFKATMNGVSYEYFWPNSPWWANKAAFFTPAFAFFAANLYTYKFLQFDQAKRYRDIYLALIGIFAVMSIVSLILPGKFTLVTIFFGLSSTVFMLGSSVHKLLQGFRPALYYLSAWVAILIGALIFGLQKLGIFPVSIYSQYGIEIASAVQGILLSLGQSEKINSYHREVRIAQQRALNAQKEINRITEGMKKKLEKLVAARTSELSEKTRDITAILNNIQQGIFTIDSDALIRGDHSEFLNEILELSDLRDRHISDVLLNHTSLTGDERAQILTQITNSMGEDQINFEANSHLLPKKLEFTRNQRLKHLELEWTCITTDDDVVEKIMVTIRDITLIRQWEIKQAELDHEQLAMQEILKVNALRFKQYIESTQQMAKECLDLMEHPDLVKVWNRILRNLHTAKGNSRTYGFVELSDCFHNIEDQLSQVDPANVNQSKRLQLIQLVSDAIELLNYYVTINDKKLERNLVGRLEEMVLDTYHFIEDLQINGALDQYKNMRRFLPLFEAIGNFAKQPIETILDPVVQSLPALARDLKKPRPNVHFSGDTLLIDRDLAKIFENVFTHLFRNSMDHGFDERDAEASIGIKIEEKDDYFNITYADSGRGLNLHKLREIGLHRQLIQESANLKKIAELIFHTGLSSRDRATSISGRGVGMNAVRDFLREIGGDIEIVLGKPKPQEGYYNFCFTIYVPKDLMIVDNHIQDSGYSNVTQLPLVALNNAKDLIS